MRDYKEQVDSLADLMEEFKLAEASMNLAGFQITFRRHAKPAPMVVSSEGQPEQHYYEDTAADAAVAAPAVAQGNPITSPMAGIYYSSANPSSPPFAKPGDVVAVGQTIALIEAMKVFNEIPSPYAGTVLEVLVEGGGLVQPGDVLMRIG